MKDYKCDYEKNRQRIAHLCGCNINWDLIETHGKEFLGVALAIQNSRVTTSWAWTRLNSYSRRNKLFRAFSELGRVFIYTSCAGSRITIFDEL